MTGLVPGYPGMRRGRERGMRPSIHAPGNFIPDNAKVATLAIKKSKQNQLSLHGRAD